MKRTVLFVFACLLGFACKEKYVPQLNLPPTGYLVVEGFINNGTGTTTIRLTRSNQIIDTSNVVYERNARVVVENKNGTTTFPLSESSPGVYSTASTLALNANEEYRVHITTKSGKIYASDYSAVRTTPDIDSVSWEYTPDGVNIFANTHDASSKSKYYTYKFEQTWEFHSLFPSSLKFLYTNGTITGLGFRNAPSQATDTTIYKCWRSDTLRNVLITTSENLSQDVVSRLPLVSIPKDAWQISVLYSINLRQYVPSQQGYRFLEQLKKNTEQLGSIFDAQPSDNIGNIHCLNDPRETTIGFVEVMQEKQKRIFISNAQVPNWNYYAKCEPEVEAPNTAADLAKVNYLLPTNMAKGDPINGVITSAFFAEPICVDCTLRGTNKKPAFWP